MTITLHCMGESGNAYKVALALELAGLDWKPIFVDFFGGETRSDEFRSEVNVMGEVPVMTDGETVLSQSGVMLQYLTDKTGKFGGAAGEHLDVLRWVLWDNHKLSSQVGPLRFQMNFLAEKHRNPDIVSFFQARVRAAYKVLEAKKTDL